jgi:hypothetical protein
MARNQGMSKAYRFTLVMPACVRTSAIGLADSVVSGSSSHRSPHHHVHAADPALAVIWNLLGA